MPRVIRRTAGSYEITCPTVDDSGEPLALVAPFHVSLYDGAGSLLLADVPTYANDTLTFDVPVGLMPYLDTYRADFTGVAGGETRGGSVEGQLVGGHLFSIAQLRGFDRAFADAVKYPTAWLEMVRDWVEDTIEGRRAARLAFVPRGRRVLVDGTAPDLTRGWNPLMYGQDYRGIRVPDFAVRKLISVSINGSALTQTELDKLTIDDNEIWRSGGVQWPAWPFGHRNISFHYEYGLDRPPGAITRAALILAREYIAQSPIPGRATATSIGDQTFRLTIAGRDGVTGLPEVDAAIQQHGRMAFGIG